MIAQRSHSDIGAVSIANVITFEVVGDDGQFFTLEAKEPHEGFAAWTGAVGTKSNGDCRARKLVGIKQFHPFAVPQKADLNATPVAAW